MSAAGLEGVPVMETGGAAAGTPAGAVDARLGTAACSTPAAVEAGMACVAGAEQAASSSAIPQRIILG